jgi:hypothetical protein
MFKRRPFIAAAAVFASYLACIVIVACVAQLGLLDDASSSQRTLLTKVLSDLLIPAFIAIPIMIASGIAPIVALYVCGIRKPAAYLANAVAAAVFGTYALFFNFALVDNAGAILVHVPSKSVTDGWVYQAPPFAQVLASAFKFLLVVKEEWPTFEVFAAFVLIFSAYCGWTFWSYVVQASDERANAPVSHDLRAGG